MTLEIIMNALLYVFIAMFATGFSMQFLARWRLYKVLRTIRPTHKYIGYCMAGIVAIHVLGETGVLHIEGYMSPRAEEGRVGALTEEQRPSPKQPVEEVQIDVETIMDSNEEHLVIIEEAIESEDFVEVAERAEGLLHNFNLLSKYVPPAGPPEHWKANVERITTHVKDLKAAAEMKDAETCGKKLAEVRAARNTCHKEFK